VKLVDEVGWKTNFVTCVGALKGAPVGEAPAGVAASDAPVKTEIVPATSTLLLIVREMRFIAGSFL
jgi:hypothetical protein